MIDSFVKEHALPSFRIAQFNLAFYKDLISSYDELTTWSKDLREKLKIAHPFSTITPVKVLNSKDMSTQKVAFSTLSRSKYFESVLMRHEDGRNTVCVSCMIGCSVGCFFCATGKMKFIANLSADEIVDQVLYFARYLKKQKQTVTNIVFMGMGEPFLNYENVKKMCEYLIDNRYFGLSKKRVTISTSGVVPPILKLVEDKIDVALALSLHAPNQTLREELIPTIAKRFKLPELMKAIDTYTKASGNKVFYEYIMIKDKTDSDELAHQTGKLLRGKPAHLNLIPYNPNPAIDDLEESDMVRIRAFQAIIMTYDIPCTVRDTMGREVGSACGQLGYEKIGGKIVRKKVAA